MRIFILKRLLTRLSLLLFAQTVQLADKDVCWSVRAQQGLRFTEALGVAWTSRVTKRRKVGLFEVALLSIQIVQCFNKDLRSGLHRNQTRPRDLGCRDWVVSSSRGAVSWSVGDRHSLVLAIGVVRWGNQNSFWFVRGIFIGKCECDGRYDFLSWLGYHFSLGLTGEQLAAGVCSAEWTLKWGNRGLFCLHFYLLY